MNGFGGSACVCVAGGGGGGVVMNGWGSDWGVLVAWMES